MEGVEERVKRMVMERREDSGSSMKDDEELMKGIEEVLLTRKIK